MLTGRAIFAVVVAHFLAVTCAAQTTAPASPTDTELRADIQLIMHLPSGLANVDKTTLDTAARAALRPGDQDHETAAHRGGQVPCGGRDQSGGGSGLGHLRLADQYVVCGAAQSEPASAGGRDATA